MEVPRPPKHYQNMKDLSFILSYVGTLCIVFGILFIFVPALPWLYYKINGTATSDEVESLAQADFFGGAVFASGNSGNIDAAKPTPAVTLTQKPIFKLPALDSSLPDKQTLKIPRSGVNGELHLGGDNAEKMLYKGLWLIPGFGTPTKNDLPIIVAAHRFGYLEWNAQFRKTNTFANLPNMRSGDTFQIYWDQRAYTYKVYNVEESKTLNDYSADVILYTCKYLKSPVRIVVYARRIA